MLREVFDPSRKGPLELARITQVPILTAIPYIETRREQMGKRRRTLMLIGLSSGGIPRVVNLLCDTALAYGFADQKPTIDATTVSEMSG